MSKKPNILILYSDQHSARAVGCYGNSQVITPNLDKLASEGITLDNAFCNNPICTPSRMCMLSGQYVHNFGYYGLMGKKPENLPHMLEYFKSFGYRTGCIGKIHTPAGWISQNCDFVADGYGFETPVTKDNTHLEEGCQGLKNDAYVQFLKENSFENERDDKILQEWYEKYQHTQGQCIDSRPSRLPSEFSFESWCKKEAVDFIKKSVNDEQPFCLWLTFPRPHQTYAPAKKFWNQYENIDLTLPPNFDDTLGGRDDASQITQKRQQQNRDWIAFEPNDFDSARQRVLRGYYACVSQMDDAIGSVLESMDYLGITDNTIILYMTDHGEFAGEHGLIEKAPGIGYSCVTKIPMIWKYAGCKKNTRRSGIVESVDVLPTICSLASLPVPDWVDGVDISSVLDNDTPVKELAVTENPHTKTLHTLQYSFTQFLPDFHNGKDFGLLYDRQKDPWELHNLYFDKNYSEIIHDLRYQLYCWYIRTSRCVTANPRIPPNKSTLDVSSGISWDLADEAGILEGDKKIGKSFFNYLIKNGQKNYL